MSNTNIYALLSETPKEAQKTISAGRLKGFTDINPMWRIQKLTEVFGPCGFGWKVVIKSQRLESAPNGEVKAFVDIDLYVKHNSEWSEAIPGNGGSAFVANEKSGPYVSDECFKMAFTDALGSACKMLGMSADIYFAAGRSKYSADVKTEEVKTTADVKPEEVKTTEDAVKRCRDKIDSLLKDKTPEERVALKKKAMKTLSVRGTTAEELEQIYKFLLNEVKS